MGFEIISSGYAKANRQVFNEEITQHVETSDEWISSRTGIHSRYISEQESTSELGARAVRMALENTGVDQQDIVAIVCATSTSDDIMPSCASSILGHLGFVDTHTIAFDLNAACTGFIYALQTGAALLQEGQYALIVGSERLSGIVDWKDRNTCVLFGDGAGAWLIRANQQKKVFHYVRSVPDRQRVLYTSGTPMVRDFIAVSQGSSYLQMNGKEVFRFAIVALEKAITELCDRAQLSLDEIDWIIPHQANLRIIQHVSKKLNIPLKHFIVNVDEFGNTSAASIAIAFAQAERQHKFLRKQKIILVGFGAGLSVGATLIER